MAPVKGDSYAIDTGPVHTFLVNFISGNDTAQAKIQGLRKPNDGREAFKRLVKHYAEGVGVHAINIREADEVIKNLFDAGGEKPSHMWWSKFEKKLTRAFYPIFGKNNARSKLVKDLSIVTDSFAHLQKHFSLVVRY